MFAAQTIVINPNFAESTVQYLQSLILTDSGGTTWIVLDGTNNKVMSDTICDTDGNNCKIISELITGSALDDYLTGTSTFLNWTDWKWCVMSAGKISCIEDEPIWWVSLWNQNWWDIYYTWVGDVGIGTETPTEKLDVNGNTHIGWILKLDSGITFKWDHYKNIKIDNRIDNGIWYDLYISAGNWMNWIGGMIIGSMKWWDLNLNGWEWYWSNIDWDLLLATNSGYVGIWTDTPTSKLDVEGTWSFNAILVQSNIYANELYTNSKIWRSPTHFMEFGFMLWMPIHTRNLTISDNKIIETRFNSSTNLSQIMMWGDNWINTTFWIIDNTWYPEFIVNPNWNYNVGIWTDNPQAKLDVAGTGKFDNIIVNDLLNLEPNTSLKTTCGYYCYNTGDMVYSEVDNAVCYCDNWLDRTNMTDGSLCFWNWTQCLEANEGNLGEL